jgi:hypothetical protein
MQVSKVKFIIKKKLSKKQSKNIRISLLKFNLRKKIKLLWKGLKSQIYYKKKRKKSQLKDTLFKIMIILNL